MTGRYFILAGVSRLRARPKGFAVALWKPSLHPLSTCWVIYVYSRQVDSKNPHATKVVPRSMKLLVPILLVKILYSFKVKTGSHPADKRRCEGVQGATAKPPARARRRETLCRTAPKKKKSGQLSRRPPKNKPSRVMRRACRAPLRPIMHRAKGSPEGSKTPLVGECRGGNAPSAGVQGRSPWSPQAKRGQSRGGPSPPLVGCRGKAPARRRRNPRPY